MITIKIDDSNLYDAGVYKIRAENAYGRAETGGLVNVNKAPVIDARPVIDPDAFKYLPQPTTPKPQPHQVVPQHVPQPAQQPERYVAPNFVVGLPANYKLHEGETIKLNCQVEGNPKPAVRYYISLKALLIQTFL